MCGIAGFFDSRTRMPQEEMLRLAAAMADKLSTRGPDDGAAWADEASGIALGHRRLSIVDLSAAGRQPMVSASGDSVLCYNGEIYNAEELRPALVARGVRFRGHSDTEIILEACEAWGPQQAAERLIGMFAFAWWDRRTRRLWLVRDRLGIKPLYWTQTSGAVLFASQPKSFFPHPQWRPFLDRDALAAYFRFGYLPSRHSIYRGLQQVQPGTIVAIDTRHRVETFVFWSAVAVARAGVDNRFGGSFEEATEALDQQLRDAVKRRMIADVPLGAFLSGGIDSSTVVALMQAQSTTPVKTFAIGFDETAYDEAPFAKAVAAHLKTDHHELYVPPAAALDTIPTLADRFDEPFADSSQIPALLVSQLTRRHVSVALSGDGGDEVFGGYPRYDFAARLEGLQSVLPRGVRRLGAAAIRSLSPSRWERLAVLLCGQARGARFGERLHKAARVVESDDAGDLYRLLTSHWLAPEHLVPGAKEIAPARVIDDPVRARLDRREAMQLRDLLAYLPEDILTKVDRASMAFGLEARVPLLDHRVVALAWRLPPSFKYAPGTSKRVLRAVLARYVPPALFERPKRGFEVPLAAWLRGPLREWADDLLSEAALAEGGVLSPAPVRAAWAAHRSGRAELHNPLWAVLMFQQWRRRWKPHL
jgi:asparagine synthase (glutamine-hydrolysing)